MSTSYDADFYAWCQAQASALRKAASVAGNAKGIDWENLAEEIESLGRSERRAMESALMRIIEHLLKLGYLPAVDPRADWMENVASHRIDLAALKDDDPGLVGRIRLAVVYDRARKLALISLRKSTGCPPRRFPGPARSAWPRLRTTSGFRRPTAPTPGPAAPETGPAPRRRGRADPVADVRLRHRS